VSKDVLRFLPFAGMLLGLVIAFAFDPMAIFLSWTTLWLPFVGLAIGFALRFGLKKSDNAR
jgi:hypothetical protein